MRSLYFVLIFIILLCRVCQSDLYDECIQNDIDGVCIPLDDCDEYLEAFISNNSFKSHLVKSNRICKSRTPIICCPCKYPLPILTYPPSNHNLPTPSHGCGLSGNKINKKIVGGTESEIGAWPWMAILGYYTSNDEILYQCGGSLITNRHVLTAAHCIRTNLVLVRLGEHDLDDDKESEHIDIEIEKIIKHPNFESVTAKFDIAILKLKNSVQFTKAIRPVCLPFRTDKIGQLIYETGAYVAGWGLTSNAGRQSNTLQEIEVSIYQNDYCKSRYRKAFPENLDEVFSGKVICAGDIINHKETCNGDSGGPLDICGTEYYHAVGIVSYALRNCSNSPPTVYTFVNVFLDWIQKSIEEA